MSTLLNELRRLPDGDPRLPGQIADFDSGCQRIVAKLGSIRPEKIEPMLKYVRFPLPRETSSEFPFGILRDSMSSGSFSDFPIRAPSFTAHPLLDASDLPRDISSDQLSRADIWQSRPYEDAKILYFECAALSRDTAAFAATSFGTVHKVLSVLKYREPGAQWQRFSLETEAGIDALCLNSNAAWALFNSTVTRVAFARRAQSARLPIVGCGNIALFGEGAMIAFPTSPTLCFVTPAMELRQIGLRYRGVTCVHTFGDSLLCGISGSGTIRQLSPDGREQRAFVGHCGQVMGLEKMSDATFASKGEDETVRIWDVRERSPVSSVLLPHTSVVSLAGSRDYIVCGFHTKRVGVVELRKDRGKALLGVQTQDYVAVAMNFDQESDSLAMFGVVDKEPIQNSMVFVDNDGQSRQRIFRKYAGFIGREAGEK
jgi:hypothetical protein